MQRHARQGDSKEGLAVQCFHFDVRAAARQAQHELGHLNRGDLFSLGLHHKCLHKGRAGISRQKSCYSTASMSWATSTDGTSSR